MYVPIWVIYTNLGIQEYYITTCVLLYLLVSAQCIHFLDWNIPSWNAVYAKQSQALGLLNIFFLFKKNLQDCPCEIIWHRFRFSQKCEFLIFYPNANLPSMKYKQFGPNISLIAIFKTELKQCVLQCSVQKNPRYVWPLSYIYALLHWLPNLSLLPHTPEIRDLCLIKWHSEMIRNLPYLMHV